MRREFDEELYEREPFRGMGAVRGAVRKFRGGSRHRQGGSAPSTPTEYVLLSSYLMVIDSENFPSGPRARDASSTMTFSSANLTKSSTNVSPSAAWAWSEEQSGNSEVEAVTARAGRPQALPLSMFFLLFASYGY